MGTRSPNVERWLAAYENPMKDAVLQAREVLLEADDRIGETIKWSTPTFVYRGKLASFQPRAKQCVNLLFHSGTAIPGEHPLLHGGGETARYVRLAEVADVDRHADELGAIVRAWCDSRDAG